MAPDQYQAEQFRLPRLFTTFRLQESACFWDVRFYPYLDNTATQPIFAVVGTSHLLVCSITGSDDVAVNVLSSIKPELGIDKPELDYVNSCTWCYVDASQPLVVVAGDSGQVNVIEALTGKLYTTLLGHGNGVINDLATHPRYPWIIASASIDTSVRIWDLRRINDPYESTCVVICGHGQAHKEGLLTVGWHSSGRYIITAGHDQKLCLWIVPDLDPESNFWDTISKEHRKRSSDDVHVVHYPHFVSSAIHSEYIDKAVFFGDLVISKAALEHKIVLWQITGFSSRQPVPDTDTAPKTNEYLDTRNGFIRKPDTAVTGESSITVQDQYRDKPLYQRLLEFDTPACPSFYMRFGFLQPSATHPEVHPTLVMGNVLSEIRFWDFERLILGHDGGLTEPRSEKGTTLAKPAHSKKGIAKKVSNTKDRMANIAWSHSPSGPGSSDSSIHSASVVPPFAAQNRETSTEVTSLASDIRSSVEGPLPDRVKYALSDPHKKLTEHKKIKLPDMPGSTLRAADWSPCGKWCLVVGEWQGTAVAVVLGRPT